MWDRPSSSTASLERGRSSSSPVTRYDSELWGDTDVVGPTYRRGSSTTSVTVRLTTRARSTPSRRPWRAIRGCRSMPRPRAPTTAINPLNCRDSSECWALRSESIMAIGAVFGALNTMYAAVATRTREIATLRALGFRARPGDRLGTARDDAVGRCRRCDRCRRGLAAVRQLHRLDARATTSARWCFHSGCRPRCCGPA